MNTTTLLPHYYPTLKRVRYNHQNAFWVIQKKYIQLLAMMQKNNLWNLVEFYPKLRRRELCRAFMSIIVVLNYYCIQLAFNL